MIVKTYTEFPSITPLKLHSEIMNSGCVADFKGIDVNTVDAVTTLDIQGESILDETELNDIIANHVADAPIQRTM